MRAPASTASIRPILAITLLGFLFSAVIFFPGWMSNDSLIQYREARAGAFNDWHPVLMAWWWRQLDRIYSGPALFLFQNLFLYWAGWGLLANSIRRYAGRYAYLVPFLGLWPGFYFVLGEIWKDVAFACCLFTAWMIVINAYSWQRKTNCLERCSLAALLVFAVGVKSNGIVAIPFLATFWLFNDRILFNARFVILVALFTGASFAIPYGMSHTIPVTHDNPFQYTQVYDLVAISSKTGRNLLPAYINERVPLTVDELKRVYVVGHNNGFFYGYTKDLVGVRAPTTADASALQTSWLSAIAQNPSEYFSHRWQNFLSLLRIGYSPAAYVAGPVVVPNEFGIKFESNIVTDRLNKEPETHPWVFYPWLYLTATLVSTIVLLIRRKHLTLALLITFSSLTFVSTHFFIAPASDYRYLYYSYFCAAIVSALAISSLVKPLHEEK